MNVAKRKTSAHSPYAIPVMNGKNAREKRIEMNIASLLSTMTPHYGSTSTNRISLSSARTLTLDRINGITSS